MAALSALLIGGYGLLVGQQSSYQLDHRGLLGTLTRMRGGAGYYGANRDTYLHEIGVRLGGPRSFRTPFVAMFLRPFPPGLYYPLFLLLVVGLTSWFLLRLTDHPWAVMPVTLYLLMAGRMPAFGGGVEGWLLVELWAVPFLAASTLAWKRERWWAAALTAAGATLIRELAAPVLVVGLVLAIRRGQPVRPWLVGLGLATAGWAVHIALALGYGSDHGTESKLWGTGAPPWSVFGIMTFAVAAPAVVGLFVWLLAAARVSTMPRTDVPPVMVLALLPVFGLLVDRPYWGLLVIPFVILWAGERVAERYAAWRASSLADPVPGVGSVRAEG